MALLFQEADVGEYVDLDEDLEDFFDDGIVNPWPLGYESYDDDDEDGDDEEDEGEGGLDGDDNLNDVVS